MKAPHLEQVLRYARDVADDPGIEELQRLGCRRFLDPHYQVVAALDREILGYREVMGLTPKSLRRLRGVPEAAVDSDPITERLDKIAARVDSYSALPCPADPYAAPAAHSLEPEEAQAYGSDQVQAWDVLNLDTDGAP